MALNLPNQPQPDFALIASEFGKCANIPAVQQGDAILQALRGLEGRFDRMNERLDRIDARLGQMDARFDRMDARFDRVDARFDRMDARFDQMEARALSTYGSSYSLLKYKIPLTQASLEISTI